MHTEVRIRRPKCTGGPTPDPFPTELQDHLLESMVDEALLTAEADRLHVEVSTASVERELQAMQQAWPPGDFQAQLESTYQTLENLRETVRSVRASAYQVVTTSRVAAQEVRKKALAGTPFADLAKTFGITPEARSGGWLGWIESGRVPAGFEPCFLLQPGEISQVIPSEYGFHVFRVEAREPARERTFDELRPELIRRLQSSRAEKITSDYLKELRGEYEIEVDETAKTLLK